MVNVSDYCYVPYLHFQNLRREGTAIWRRGKVRFVTVLLFMQIQYNGKNTCINTPFMHGVEEIIAERMHKTDKTLRKTDRKFNKTDKKPKKTDRILKKADRKFGKTGKILEKIDRILRKMDRKFNKMNKKRRKMN